VLCGETAHAQRVCTASRIGHCAPDDEGAADVLRSIDTLHAIVLRAMCLTSPDPHSACCQAKVRNDHWSDAPAIPVAMQSAGTAVCSDCLSSTVDEISLFRYTAQVCWLCSRFRFSLRQKGRGSKYVPERQSQFAHDRSMDTARQQRSAVRALWPGQNLQLPHARSATRQLRYDISLHAHAHKCVYITASHMRLPKCTIKNTFALSKRSRRESQL
jgi:hypothetical protein